MNEAPATLESLAERIREAHRQRAQLLVLPECAYPAYLLGSPESYRAGEHLDSDDYLAWLSRHAAETGMHIVSGFVEDTGETLFNSAILIGPDGEVIGRTRKRLLWHVDQDWFQPGEEIAVFPTAIGRIGMIICAEARVPELIATLAAQGAEIIAMPTCWINASRQPGEYYNPQSDYLIEARAREFGIPFVCADKSGMELTVGYVGQSCVVTPEGGPVAMAPSTGESLVVSQIRPAPPAPVWMSDSRRARLLGLPGSSRQAGISSTPDRLPARTEPCPRTLAAVSTAYADRHFTGGMGEGLFKPLRERGVQILAANIAHEAAGERLGMLARAFDMQAAAFPERADVFDIDGVRAGCMAGEWLRSFATARCLALEGAELLICFDAADVAMLRTRALENRVFVMGVAADSSILIGPDGSVLAAGTADEPAVAAVDIAEASDKQVAPRTDIFAQRRPQAYRF